MSGIVTTVLDLLGAVLVVAGLAVLVGQWSPPAGLAVAGMGLLVVSWLADLLGDHRGGDSR